MYHLKHVHFQKALLDVFSKSLLLENFALFHLELHAVFEHNKIKSVVLEDSWSNFQCRHHITNEELLNVFFKNMKFVMMILETFDHRWIMFGWIGAFTFENLTERTFTDDFILMSWTWLLLIKDCILFGKVLKLAKHLNHIIRRGWRAYFNFDLIMIPPWLLILLLKLELLHQ